MDKDEVIFELYTCLLKANGCVEALSRLAEDFSLESSMPGLSRVRGEVQGCLEKHKTLHRDLDVKRILGK